MALRATSARGAVATRPSRPSRSAVRISARSQPSSTAGYSQAAEESEERAKFSRRQLFALTSAAIALPVAKAQASEGAPTFTSYTDPKDRFSLQVPNGWAIGEGALSGNSSFQGASGERRTVVWFPEGANARDVNLSIVITNVSVEFTKLGSFGTPLQFASNLVNSQDRSYLLKASKWGRGDEPIQIAKLVDAGETSDKYFLEYTVQKLPEPQRHLYSSLGLGSNGVYNRLYTVTGQCLEADRAKYDEVLRVAVKSLMLPPSRA